MLLAFSIALSFLLFTYMIFLAFFDSTRFLSAVFFAKNGKNENNSLQITDFPFDFSLLVCEADRRLRLRLLQVCV